MDTIQGSESDPTNLSAPLCCFCESKIGECDSINSAGINAYLVKQEAAVDKAQQLLTPLCKPGPASGLAWQDSLGEDPSWDDFEAACKQHLLQNEYVGTQLPQLRNSLLQDRAIAIELPLSTGRFFTIRRPPEGS